MSEMNLKTLLLRGKDSESVYLNAKRLLNFMERHDINIDITLNERDKRLEITINNNHRTRQKHSCS